MIVIVWDSAEVQIVNLDLWNILIDNGFDQHYLDKMSTAFCVLK